MRNLLLLLLLANILYFIWEMVIEEPPEAGVAIVEVSDLGPPFKPYRRSTVEQPQAATSVDTVLASSGQMDLAAVVGRSCVSVGPFTSGPDAQQVFQDYRQEDMPVAVRSTQGQLFVGHWVQIRDVPDRQTANLMIDKLV
ncbi:MAG: hypothetical protein ACREQ1_16665, partial [Woeseiaceae bacterium]